MHNPHRNSISRHLKCLNRVIDENRKTYDNLWYLHRRLNAGIGKNSMKKFCRIKCSKSLIKVPTCFKNPGKPTCIDLILTNRPNFFNTAVILKQAFRLPSFDSNWIQMWFQKLKPKIIAYRDYKNFDNAKFRYIIVTATSNIDNFCMYKSTILIYLIAMCPQKRSIFMLMRLPPGKHSSWWRRTEDVLKTSWRCLQNVFEDEKVLRWRRLEDSLKTSWKTRNFFWASCQKSS